MRREKRNIIIIVILISILLICICFNLISKLISRIKVRKISNNTNINQIAENTVTEDLNIKLDRYKILNNQKLAFPKVFDYEKYKELIDKIYNYEAVITLKDINAEEYFNIAKKNNIFIDLVVKDIYPSIDEETLVIEYKNETKEDHIKELKEAEAIIRKVIVEANTNVYELEKVLYVYTYWATNIEYDYASALNETEPNIYNVLFDKKGLYKNYAEMIDYTLCQMDIECYLIYGDTALREAHEWNLVKINNNYYQLDATYENQNTEGKGLMYFGRTKEEMAEEGRSYMEWYEGFSYDDFSNKESNNLNIVKEAVNYRIENHTLILYNKLNEQYAKIDIETME